MTIWTICLASWASRPLRKKAESFRFKRLGSAFLFVKFFAKVKIFVQVPGDLTSIEFVRTRFVDFFIRVSGDPTSFVFFDIPSPSSGDLTSIEFLGTQMCFRKVVPRQVLGRKIRECVKPPGRVATEHTLVLGC